jgi:hypothetical protein
VKLGNEFLELLEKIRGFFRKNKLERPPKKIDGESIRSAQIEAATTLAHELGNSLGLTAQDVEYLINLTGSPISTPKLLVALATEAGKLSTLEQHKKIHLKEIPLQPAPAHRGGIDRGTPGSRVVVKKKKSRKAKQ